MINEIAEAAENKVTAHDQYHTQVINLSFLIIMTLCKYRGGFIILKDCRNGFRKFLDQLKLHFPSDIQVAIVGNYLIKSTVFPINWNRK